MVESRVALSEEDATAPVVATPPNLPIPLADYVLLKILPKGDQVTDAGLVIPDVVADEPIQGEVVAVGLGRTTDTGAFLYMDPRIIPQVRVLFAKHAGFELEVERVKYRMLRAEEILGVYS